MSEGKGCIICAANPSKSSRKDTIPNGVDFCENHLRLAGTTCEMCDRWSPGAMCWYARRESCNPKKDWLTV